MAFNAYWIGAGALDVYNHRYALPAILIGVTALRRVAQLYRVNTRQLAAGDYNWSLFTEFRADRVAATALMAHSAKLFKAAQ